jgi:hypothetical protein
VLGYGYFCTLRYAADLANQKKIPKTIRIAVTVSRHHLIIFISALPDKIAQNYPGHAKRSGDQQY